MSNQPDGPVLKPPAPIRIGVDGGRDLPNEVEMPLVDHLEELRQRVLSSLLAVVGLPLLWCNPTCVSKYSKLEKYLQVERPRL